MRSPRYRSAIHNLYANTFGAPWLVAAIVLAGCWAMWKALVQRRYTETAGALAVSLLVLRAGDRDCHAARTHDRPGEQALEPALHGAAVADNEGSISNEQQAKSQASDQLFELLVLNPWTVLEFGGIEHCTTTSGGKTHSVAVRPLSSNPAQDSRLAAQLESGVEVHAEGKTCINNRNKYAPHFLAYPYQSPGRNSEHEALEHGDDRRPPELGPREGQRRLPARQG